MNPKDVARKGISECVRDRMPKLHECRSAGVERER